MTSRRERGSRVYNNFYNGNESAVSDNEYQMRLRLIDIEKHIRKIFNNSRLELFKIPETRLPDKDKIVYRIYNESSDKYIFLSVHLIKNSGMDTDRKRIQIYSDYFGIIKNGNQRKENESYFFLGLYPIGSNGECVYVLLENDGCSLNPQVVYSSLWIDFNALKSTVINGIYFGVNKRNGNKYVSFRENYKDYVIDALEHDDYSTIVGNSNSIHILNENGSESTNQDIYVDEYIPSRDAVVTVEGKAKIKKNSALREIAFIEAHYKCALCGKENTFITNNEKMYFEAHHLIPCNINIQREFAKKLDHTLNLFCLCPECHRKIHLIKSDNVGSLLEKLYQERKTSLEEVYNLDLSHLINIYQGIDRRDEDNM